MGENARYDVIVIGAGPGGYAAAIRASQLGLNAAVIDKRASLGGTCVNTGCIPAKSLLDATEFFAAVRDRGGEFGVRCDNLSFDLAAIMARKDAAVERFARGVSVLMREYKIAVYRGSAKLASPRDVEVTDDAGGTLALRGEHIIIAVGSVPAALPQLAQDGRHIVGSDEALAFDAVPESLAVIGAGAVGLELGSVWMRLGSKVTVVELADRILPGMDLQAARSLQQLLKKQGMAFSLSTSITGCAVKSGAVELKGKKAGGDEYVLGAAKVLVAAGRKPNLAGLGLEGLDIGLTGTGRIKVDQRYRTSQQGVYAIGDVIEGPMLAHKAGEEGIAAAECIAGKEGRVNYGTIPAVVYTWPELASAGLTEEQCREGGVPYRKGMFYFRANGRGLTSGGLDGFVKIIAHAVTDRVLGGSVLGPWASDLIAEIVSVMEFGGSSEDIARTVHAHPTLGEVVKEAALDVEGRAIHAGPNRGRENKGE